jgi:hypothetical protein
MRTARPSIRCLVVGEGRRREAVSRRSAVAERFGVESLVTGLERHDAEVLAP